MNALWLVILRILWRLRPVQALEMNLHTLVQLGFQIFSSDDLDDLIASPERRARLAASYFDAHRKLDLLIYHRACEIAGIPTRLGFKPDYSCTHSSTDIHALWQSFLRLVAKFDDYERYAQRRAERLKREATTIPPSLRDSPLRLDAAHRSTSPGSAGGGRLATALSPPSRKARGRWIGAPSRRDGRGCASSRGCLRTRGPPLNSIDCPLPTADCLSRSATEVAPA